MAFDVRHAIPLRSAKDPFQNMRNDAKPLGPALAGEKAVNFSHHVRDFLRGTFAIEGDVIRIDDGPKQDVKIVIAQCALSKWTQRLFAIRRLVRIDIT